MRSVPKHLLSIFIVGMTLSLATPTTAQVPLLANPVVRRVLGFTVDYVAGKVVDSLIDMIRGDEKTIKDRVAQLEAASRRAKTDSAAVHSELNMLRSTLKTLQLALDTRGHPTTSQREEFIASFNRSLEVLEGTVQQHEQCISVLENGLSESKEKAARDHTSLLTMEEDVAVLKLKVGALTEANAHAERLDVATRVADDAPVKHGLPVAGSFIALGAQYGSVRTDFSNAVTTSNYPVGLGRLGWRFNRHFSLGLEGSYWYGRTRSWKSATGTQVTLAEPVRDSGSAIAMPLYFTVSESFPLQIYLGPGMAWESHEVVNLNPDGTVQSRWSTSGSGKAWIAGAGFEFQLSEGTSLLLVGRAVRSRMSTLSSNSLETVDHQPERTVLAVGAALSFYL